MGQIVLPRREHVAVGQGDGLRARSLPRESIVFTVICRYIGAYTLHTCEKRAACWTAIAFSSGSICRLAFSVAGR